MGHVWQTLAPDLPPPLEPLPHESREPEKVPPTVPEQLRRLPAQVSSRPIPLKATQLPLSPSLSAGAVDASHHGSHHIEKMAQFSKWGQELGQE